jgi:hypothetical protein
VRLQRSLPHGDSEALVGEVHHPWAQLGPRGVEASPPQEGDEGPVAAAEIQDPGGRQGIPEQHPEPVQTALGQIEAGALHDVREAQLVALPREPVLLAVEALLVVANLDLVRGETVEGHQSAALRQRA